MKAAALHDRGYRAYEGARHLSSRWTVVLLRQVRSLLKQRAVVVLLVLALVDTAIFAAVAYFSSKVSLLAGKSPDTAKLLYQIVLKPYGSFFLSVMMAAYAGGGAIADDARAGAFQLYFARPLSREQYLAGKWAAVAVLVGSVSILPAALLSGVRVSMETTPRAFLEGAQAILLAAILTAALTSTVVALSSTTRRRGVAQAGLVAIVFMLWMVGRLIAEYTRNFWPQLVSLPANLDAIGSALFSIPNEIGDRAVPPLVAAGVLAVVIAGGILLARRRLQSVEVVAG